MSCAISGESLATLPTDVAVVVTPSGRICQRQLLEAKLSENNGKDPFSERPLTLEDCIVLNSNESPAVPPTSTSTRQSLQALQNDYDSLTLQLFDTRKLLQETQQELSLALYQNDAAVRVIGRLAMERDQARQNTTSSGTSTDEPSEPRRKKQKPSLSPVPATVIPDSDQQVLMATWKKLHASRKALVKKLGAQAPKDLKEWVLGSVMSQDAQVSGVVAMVPVKDDTTIASVGKDASILLQSLDGDSTQTLTTLAKGVTCIDANGELLVTGTSTGSLQWWNIQNNATTQTPTQISASRVQNVALHPDGEHVVACTESGKVCLLSLEERVVVGTLIPDSEAKVTCGQLHPDGLLYVCGTAFGSVLVWDFKSQALGATLAYGQKRKVAALSCSPNGYNLAVAYENGAVLLWNLIKQTFVELYNQKDPIESVQFDPSGKNVVIGGPGAAVCVNIKSKKVAATWSMSCASHVAWASNKLLVASRRKGGVGVITTKK